MILIGQFDSPFVRRVGIAMTLYELPFSHRPWSVFGDVEKIRPYKDHGRAPERGQTATLNGHGARTGLSW